MEQIKYFKPIDADQYVRQGIVEGRFRPEEVRKTARIRARQGKEGERIETILPNGLSEVVGTVKVDPRTGGTGWIATNPGGEEYIIEDGDFQDMYMADPAHPGEFKKKVPALAVQIDENVVFTNKWGEEMRVEAGGHLIFFDGARGPLGKGTYGVAREAWDETYERTGTDDREALRQAIKAYGITREEMEEAIAAREAKVEPSAPKKTDGHLIDD